MMVRYVPAVTARPRILERQAVVRKPLPMDPRIEPRPNMTRAIVWSVLIGGWMAGMVWGLGQLIRLWVR